MSKAQAVSTTHHLVRMLVPAAKASPSPPVGPALGAKGVKSMDFCKEFNARTQHINPNVPIPTDVYVAPDRSFTFKIKTPPTSWFLKTAVGANKLMQKPPGGPVVVKGSTNVKQVGVISLKHVYEIAKIKQTDEHLKHIPLRSLCVSIIATCKNVGIKVVH